MTFKQFYLQEKFYKADNIKTMGGEKYTEVFMNPTKKELNEVYKASGKNQARIGIDNEMNLYVFRADVLHDTVKRRFLILMKWLFIHRKGDKEMLVSIDSEPINGPFKKQISTTIKKYMPKIKILIGDEWSVKI